MKSASARRTRSRWAKRGTRPSAPKDQRTISAYIFICPNKGKAAGLVMPYANTEALNAHLKEIACIVEPGSHAVVMPSRMAHLPGPRSSRQYHPYATPAPGARAQSRRERSSCATTGSPTVSSKTMTTSSITVAWNNLVSQRITSIGTRKWANEF